MCSTDPVEWVLSARLMCVSVSDDLVPVTCCLAV